MISLIIFSAANLKTSESIKSVLNEFLLGLAANPSESTVYCSSIPSVLKQPILDCLQVKGVVPV
jgi:hypothetical protein